MEYRYLKTRGALTGRDDEPIGWAPGRSGPLRPDPRAVALLPEPVAREHAVIPVGFDGETLLVAAADPGNIAVADRLSFLIARPIRLVPAARPAILDALRRHFGDEDHDEDESVDSMLQEFAPAGAETLVMPTARARAVGGSALPDWVLARQHRPIRTLNESAPPAPEPEPTTLTGAPGVFTYVVEEGQRVLLRRPNGTMEVLTGPRRVLRGGNAFRPMKHFVAHPGDYLIVRFRDGRQEHLPGPSELWLDPRIHQSVEAQEGLQIAAKEAVVVYSQKPGGEAVQRRIETGPAVFIPRPGEWLHTFSWHASHGGSKGVVKVPNGLVFQKLWLMPDQMYHDVPDVRTADDAVLTIRLMLFFELVDIGRMLETTHDPIGDFVNAATSDVVDFTGRHDFESFKHNTDQLNELSTYRQLIGRAGQCGYRIDKVVYRGYGAPERLQQMHDQAIEARTRLQLERATEQQAQDLENFKLDSQLARAGKRRSEQANEVEHDLALDRKRHQADLESRTARNAFDRDQARQSAEIRHDIQSRADAQRRDHLSALRDLGVDLTAYLTQSRADRVIEVRAPDGGATHVHLDPAHNGAEAAKS